MAQKVGIPRVRWIDRGEGAGLMKLHTVIGWSGGMELMGLQEVIGKLKGGGAYGTSGGV